jgi:hypothetical protein
MKVNCISNLCAYYTQYIAPNISVTIIYDCKPRRVGHTARSSTYKFVINLPITLNRANTHIGGFLSARRLIMGQSESKQGERGEAT